MKLTKEECLDAIESLKEKYVGFTEVILTNYEAINTLEQLINEHFKLESNFESTKKLYDSLLSDYEDTVNKCHKLETALMNACKYLKKAGVVYDKKNGKPIRLSKENWYIRLMEDSNE